MSNDKSRPEDSHGSLIRSTSILSLGTLSSRILGFLRDVVLARVLGTGLRAEAFFVALKIPNLFRDMVAEGATNAAVVPVFSEYLNKETREDKEDFWRFVSLVFVSALIGLSCLTVIGILAAPILVRVIVPGFMADPEKLHLAIKLTKMMFPYLIFIGLTAYAVAALFTFRSFVVPAFSPCLLNLAILASAYFALRTRTEPVLALAIGVLAGGALQLAAQMGPLKKIGFRFFWPKKVFHPGAVKILRLMIPRIIGSGIYQLTVLIDVFCASLSTIIGVGGISAVYYANRIIHLPMGIFGVALASATLPALSSMASRDETENMKHTIVFSLENIFFVMCPTTVILLFLSEPIIRVLFQRGAFDAYSTGITSWALFFYAMGLFSFGGIKILVVSFHALQDTKTPVKIAAACLALNAGLNAALMFPLKIGGIALASSISGMVNFSFLFYILDKRLGGLKAEFIRFLSRIFLACGIMAVALYIAWTRIPWSNEFLKLVVTGIGAYGVFGIVCFALRMDQARQAWTWIMLKGKGKNEGV